MKRALASIALLVGAGTAHAEQPNLRGFMEVLPTYAYATRGDADGGIGTRITGGIVVPGSVSVGVFLGYRMIRGLTEISERDIEVTTQDLAAEWAKASVAVLASRGEGYPLVLQEAMSAGVKLWFWPP